MGEKLLQLDQDLFVYLHSHHTSWLDPVMYYMTNTYFWLPLHALLLYLIVKNYGKDCWLVLVCVTLGILAANTITSEIMKPYFLRLRPSHELQLENMIHIVRSYKGGKYGFASSHAATTFALAMFVWTLFRKQYNYIGWLFAWASLISYTRIYLGVHYPGDVLVGALVGVMCGWSGFKLYQQILIMINRKRNSTDSA